MIRYYPINLSWSNVSIWMPAIVIFLLSSKYIMDENPIGSLWQPMPFVGEKNAYAWEVFIINYITSSLFLHQMEAIMFTVLQIYFDMQRKMFMNSLLFIVREVHFSVFSEVILWPKKHVPSSLTTTQCFSSWFKS